MPNPFGLKSGETPDSAVASYVVTFHAVPNPHPDMKDYSGLWQPERGLVSVRASSSVFDEDRYGSKALALYDRLKRQLTSVYGSAEAAEFIDDDATWDDNDEYVASIFHEERFHGTIWNEEVGSKLDAGIKKITLMIDAHSNDAASVTILYEFTKGLSFAPGEDVGITSL